MLIFDCDGVLVDTEPLVNRVFLEELGALGRELDADASLREFAGAALAQRVEVIEARHRWRAPAGFLERFHEHFARRLRAELEAVPGIEAVLRALRGPRCVASNGSLAEVRLKLELAGLSDCFEGRHLFSAESVHAPKPDPALHLHAARSMGAAPAECVVIEDSVPGVQAAVRAGMRVLGYAGRTDAHALAAAGARVFREMAELPRLLALAPEHAGAQDAGPR